MSRPIYRGLYFNPDRPDDLEILRWLVAMPRSQRSRAIKAVLRAGLGAYVAAHYPDQSPPAAKEVPSRLAAASRSTPPRDTGRRAVAAPSPVARPQLPSLQSQALSWPNERPPLRDPVTKMLARLPRRSSIFSCARS